MCVCVCVCFVSMYTYVGFCEMIKSMLGTHAIYWIVCERAILYIWPVHVLPAQPCINRN